MKYYVYIATNKRNTVFYIGITNNIERRMFEHDNKLNEGFTKKYNINKLVYYYEFNEPKEAIEYEKKLKGWKRNRKIELIKQINPEFKDLVNT